MIKIKVILFLTSFLSKVLYMSIVQSVLFDSNIWDVPNAVAWLVDNNFKVIKIHKTDKKYRFRQVSPDALKKKGYVNYMIKKLNNGVELVIAYKSSDLNYTTRT